MAFGNATVDEFAHAPRSLLHDTVNTFIALLAVLGNGLVIFVMLARRDVFKSFTNRLLLHQSVIDSINGVMLFLHQVVIRSAYVSVSTEGNFYDQLVCRLVGSDFFPWSLNVASTYNLVVISLERLIATCYPVRHRNTCSVSKLKYAVATPWVIGFGYGSHLLFVLEAKVNQGFCDLVDNGRSIELFFGMVSFGTEYLVPLVTILYAYTRILTMLRKKLANPVNARQDSLSKAKKNVLVTTLLAAVMFIICWTPAEWDYFTFMVFSRPFNELFYTICATLLACNLWINPVIYCLKYKHFRTQLKDVLRKGFGRNRVRDSESSSQS